ncbi:hypothetical protein ACFYPG_09440 [Micromonospora sp. NPDC005553]|uniref:hypothetical protein n=1 Tax=Micromonospora sp. NPDC005553 TaxID=3364232 RepID=UPI00368162C8
MTLVLAWVRNYSDQREMVMASDSRLTGGGALWNCCPKIVSLPRSDAILAFAGMTDIAYPAMLQIVRAIEANPASIERRYDITQLAHAVQEVLNQMLDERIVERGLLEGALADKSQTTFILGGWSWRWQQFRMWLYTFDRATGRYYRRKSSPDRHRNPNVHLLVTGDVKKDALREFALLRRSRGLTGVDPLNMEPLEVLRDMIRSGSYRSIGGAPQIMKVYRHMNAESFGVLWRRAPEAEAIATYGGRPLLDYEKPFFALIDPDRPEEHGRYIATARARASSEGTKPTPSPPGQASSTARGLSPQDLAQPSPAQRQSRTSSGSTS